MKSSEVASLAEGTVLTLSNYLANLEVGKNTNNHLQIYLHKLVSDKLSSNLQTKELFQEFNENPNDPDIQTSLFVVVKKGLTSDTSFLNQVRDTISMIVDSSTSTEAVETQKQIITTDASSVILTSSIGGALIGSVVPGVGTVIGAVIGASIGYLSNNKGKIEKGLQNEIVKQVKNITEKITEDSQKRGQ